MFSLTQREQFVILTIMMIFLIGLGVKQYRASMAQAAGYKLQAAGRNHREAMITTNWPWAAQGR
ncbi:MAG: hypothetical protein K2W97_06630 [Chthoniobacterales bacterium]|nr:hypothetical protein [Chthoniobacterales bacterium]